MRIPVTLWRSKCSGCCSWQSRQPWWSVPQGRSTPLLSECAPPWSQRAGLMYINGGNMLNKADCLAEITWVHLFHLGSWEVGKCRDKWCHNGTGLLPKLSKKQVLISTQIIQLLKWGCTTLKKYFICCNSLRAQSGWLHSYSWRLCLPISINI